MIEQDQLKLSPSKIETGRRTFTPAPIDTTTIDIPEQQTKMEANVLPSRAPIWRDSNGNLSYNQPDSYNWFSAFTDRRLYAQTEGGAGYWLGGRTPSRMFYEWSIGDFQGSEVDQSWVINMSNEDQVQSWVKSLRSSIGLSEQILMQDFGETVLEDTVRSSVSANNLSAKIAFMLDSAESKRRIEEYDASSSWGGYIGTKVLSAVGNYMAVDPITTATTIATLGTGTLLPAAARSTFLATRLPWLSTPLNTAKTWWMAHSTGLAKANFAFNALDGALSGYAYHLGYNQDQSILLGDNAVLDTNPLDDIAIGGTIGLLGGWMGYYMNLRQISRQAAIESVAQTMGTIPHQFAIDHATRYVIEHGQFLRELRRAGLDVTSDLYRKLQDPVYLRNAGFRSPAELRAIGNIIKSNKPDASEIARIIDSKLIGETNETIDFFNYVGRNILELEKSGKAVRAVTKDGRKVIDFKGNRGDILLALRNGDDTTNGSTARLLEMGFTEEQAQRFYNYFDSRSGVDEFDFHEWLWSRGSEPEGLMQDLRLLDDFITKTEVEELNVIKKHFPSAVPDTNETGLRFLADRHGQGRSVEGVLSEISEGVGQKKTITKVVDDEFMPHGKRPTETEVTNHVLEDAWEIKGQVFTVTPFEESMPAMQRSAKIKSIFEGDIKEELDDLIEELEGFATQTVDEILDQIDNVDRITPDREGLQKFMSMLRDSPKNLTVASLKSAIAEIRVQARVFADEVRITSGIPFEDFTKRRERFVQLLQDLKRKRDDLFLEVTDYLDPDSLNAEQRSLLSKRREKIIKQRAEKEKQNELLKLARQKAKEQGRSTKEVYAELLKEENSLLVRVGDALDRGKAAIVEKLAATVGTLSDVAKRELKYVKTGGGNLMLILSELMQGLPEGSLGRLSLPPDIVKGFKRGSWKQGTKYRDKVFKTFDDLIDLAEKQVDYHTTRIIRQEHASMGGIVDLEIFTRNIDNPEFKARMVQLRESIETMKEVIARVGRVEDDFMANGVDLTNGHPNMRWETFINSNDEELTRAYGKFLKEVEDIDAKYGKGVFQSAYAESLDRAVKQRMLKNDLLRVRLKNGIIAEQLGLLNTRSTIFNTDSRLIDGALPFRSRNNVGTPDAPVLKRVSEELDIDDSARLAKDRELDSLSDEEWSARLKSGEDADELPAEVSVKQKETNYDRQAIDMDDPNERLSRRLGAAVRMEKRDVIETTKYREMLKEGNSIAGVIDVLSEISRGIPKGATGKISMMEILARIRGVIEMEGDVPVLYVKDTPVGYLNPKLIDDMGDIDVQQVADLLQQANTNMKDFRAKLKTEFDSGTLNQTQYNNIMNYQGIGNGEWSFAAANGAVTALRQIPVLGDGLVRLGEWMMVKSMDIQGSTASRLWFNRESRRNYRGMNAMEQILMFANMIDSPHVLKRDFGNIIDLNFFSAQQIRNNNARQANKVIARYRELHSTVGVTIEDNNLVIDALMQGDPSLLTNQVQRELYTLTLEFFGEFGADAAAIMTRNGTNLTAAQIDNIIRNNTVMFNQSRVLTNRNAVRTTIRNNLQRYVRNNLQGFDMSRGVARAMYWDTALAQRALAANNLNVFDTAIANARTVADLQALLSPNVRLDSAREMFGLRVLLDQLTDVDVQRMTSVNDFIATLENYRTTTTVLDDYIASLEEFIVDRMDRTRRFQSSQRARFNNGLELAGVRRDPVVEDVLTMLLSEPDMRPYQIRSIPELVLEYANSDGLNLRMQAQISREFGNLSVFQILEHARRHLTDVAREAERDGLSNAMRNLNDTMDILEQRMAHALGFQLEANPRQGWGEASFRLQNGMIRADTGAFWGLQTAIAEIPKALILSAGRNGIINSIIDLISAIRNRADLDDLGYALEQYTQRFALGIDNEAYAGRVQMNRVPVTGQITGVNVNPMRPIRRTYDILTGTQVDTAGAAVSVAQRGGNALETGAARVTDAAVNLTESLANTNSRLGGQQTFLAIGRDMAVRKGKRQIVNNIDRLINFSREFAASNFDQIQNFSERLAAFKRLAKKHKLEWDFVVRMNHHGLLDIADLELMRTAMRRNNVVPPVRRIAGVEISGGGRNPYRLPELLDELERISQTSGTTSRRDEIAAKLSAFLDEEANTALNTATTIGSNPNANLIQRWLFQFSNYARGFQHQTILRGANDSTIAKWVSMLVPVIIGEMVYSNVRRMIEGSARGDKTMEQAKDEIAARYRENPELVIYETFSRVPIVGGVQSFMLNSVVNPLAMDTTGGRQVRDKIITNTHERIYQGTDWAVGMLNERMNTDLRTNDFVAPAPNMNNVYLPSFYPWDFKPYTDGYKFIQELTLDNPYRNKEREFFGVPNGRVYSMVPGYRTWQTQLALRMLGYPAYSPDPRARKFDKK